MNHRLQIVLVLSLTIAACVDDGAGSTTSMSQVSSSEAVPSEEACPTTGVELETAKLYIEHNATDADTGVHGVFGGEAWSELCVWDPDGNLILFVDPRSQLDDLTVSDFFFESREPPNDEYTVDDLRSDFPEGEYVVGVTDFEGTAHVGVAVFTHDMPAEPVITTPDLADEEEAESVVVDSADLTVTWEPVVETITGDPVSITGYEVILTKVEHEDPNGWSQPVYDVHLGPDATSLSVPEMFLEPGTVYELEVLALEVSGNQTIGLGFFTTE
jgi:hypothetical protein